MNEKDKLTLLTAILLIGRGLPANKEQLQPVVNVAKDIIAVIDSQEPR